MTFNKNTSLASHIGFAAFSTMCGSNERHSSRPRAVQVRKNSDLTNSFSQESPLSSAITLTAAAAKHLLQTKHGVLATMLQAVV